MKVLWLCNIMMPVIADRLGMESTNKEGWLSGLMDRVLKGQGKNKIELAVAFPGPRELFQDEDGDGIFRKVLRLGGNISGRNPAKEDLGENLEGDLKGDLKKDLKERVLTEGSVPVACYGFYEDVTRPDVYDASLEEKMGRILEEAAPDVVHCFGTEYPHTLAMCRVFPDKKRLLVGIQGLCAIYARAYFADLPESVIRQVTLRDWLKKDSLRKQQEKFVRRGVMEQEAVQLAGNITGRTQWDKDCTGNWNRESRYFYMNETLRPEFYGGVWNLESCIPHSIFLSQGDYPIKGLHYMLTALPAIARRYPDVTVNVAGNSIVAYETWKQKLKISAYGKYLRSLLEQDEVKGRVHFLGKLDAEQMRQQYLRSHLFVCCSSIENSPNSLGEAMLLGMPCVSADVGGITSLFKDGVDGIVYEGSQVPGCVEDGSGNASEPGCVREKMPDVGSGRTSREMELVAERLAGAVIRMWDQQEEMLEYCRNAREHAAGIHDGEKNYQRLVEIYTEIVDGAM